MIDLDQLSPIGFGSYRVSIRSNEHKEALELALKNGCNLIDTSANYTDGESEKLIGEVLSENDNLEVCVITKAGYIQGNNLSVLSDLQSSGLLQNEGDVVSISEQLKHSIHPDFLQSQINLSLERLQRKYIDVFLLHNPEYYFDDPNGKKDPEEYYAQIKKAFEFLEKKVSDGVIRYYGISSNTFPLDITEDKTTNLLKVIEVAKEVSTNHHFKYIQFPFNFIENDAVQLNYEGRSLIEVAKENKLVTLANRPLNAFLESGLLRIASYEFFHQDIKDEDINDIENICMKLLRDKFKSNGYEDEFDSIPLIEQIKKIWRTLPSPDSVDQVFMGHLFPFIAQVYGKNLTGDESKPFYLWYDTALVLSRRAMTDRANEFHFDLIKRDILDSSEKPLSYKAVKYYLDEVQIDHVLVGMRKIPYVEQLKELF